MRYKNLSIEKIFHAATKIKGQTIIYIDPFNLPDNSETADVIFITHEHHDHLSPEDIKKIAAQNTAIVATPACEEKLVGFDAEKIIYVKPGDNLEIKNIKVEVAPAYNINKFRSPGVPFHPKEHGKVGYVLEIEKVRIYQAGDTDNIPEMRNLKNIDIALLPISGTYTMTVEEAAEAANLIKPKSEVANSAPVWILPFSLLKKFPIKPL